MFSLNNFKTNIFKVLLQAHDVILPHLNGAIHCMTLKQLRVFHLATFKALKIDNTLIYKYK